MALYTIQIPEKLYRRLQAQAKAEHRPVDELIQKALARQLPPTVPVENDLPPLLHDELLAMEQLSDGALWQLARSTLSEEDLAELERLGDGPSQTLTPVEETRKQALLREYDETLLRRAHAAMLLQGRGFDMSDPFVLARS